MHLANGNIFKVGGHPVFILGTITGRKSQEKQTQIMSRIILLELIIQSIFKFA